MADHEKTAFVVGQGAPQFRLGVHIQVIGGLVQQQYIGLPVKNLAQPYLGLFTAA